MRKRPHLQPMARINQEIVCKAVPRPRRCYTKPAMGRLIYAIDARFLFAAFDSLG
jgi:hypothetical protein